MIAAKPSGETASVLQVPGTQDFLQCGAWWDQRAGSIPIRIDHFCRSREINVLLRKTTNNCTRPMADVIGRSRAKILDGYFGAQLPLIIETKHGGLNHYISAQLPLLLVTLGTENNSRYSSVARNSEQCEKRYPIFKFGEITALISLSIFGFWWGLPRRAGYGFAARLGAIVCYIMGVYLVGTHVLGLSENASASLGSCGVSASTYGRSEDVRVVPIVIAKFEFRNIERQIFAANLVISSNDASFDERPKAFNRIRVNCVKNVLANGVIYRLMRKAVFQPLVSGIVIGAEQANPVRYGFADESFKREPIGVLNDAGNDVALALNGSDNGGFACVSAPARTAFLIPMTVLVAAADVGFIHLDDAHEFAEFRVSETCAHAMCHVEGGQRNDDHLGAGPAGVGRARTGCWLAAPSAIDVRWGPIPQLGIGSDDF